MSCSRPQLCKVWSVKHCGITADFERGVFIVTVFILTAARWCLFLQRRQRAAIGGVYLFLPLNKLPIIEELFLMPGAGAGASAASALDL